MKKRNHYSAEFKSKVVLEVLQEASTINGIAAKHGISPVVIGRWKSELQRYLKKGLSQPKKNWKKKMKELLS